MEAWDLASREGTSVRTALGTRRSEEVDAVRACRSAAFDRVPLGDYGTACSKRGAELRMIFD